MDPSLRRERELFKKKAFDVPMIEKRKREDDGDSKKSKASKVGPSTSSQKSQALDFQKSNSMYSNLSSAASAYKFGVLTKIVKHLKQKFQEGDDFPLSLSEILDETNQMDVNTKVQQWLATEALPNNLKIETTYEGKFQFKPPLKCRDKKSLLRLLRSHDMKGLGGIFRDDVIESVPHAERVLKNIDSELITITRQDKKKVLFYNDRQADLIVDEEFQKNWRAVAVDGIDDAKIEEYLDKQGIRSMQDQGVKKPVQRNPRRKGQRKKVIKKPKDNDHLADVLKNYDE